MQRSAETAESMSSAKLTSRLFGFAQPAPPVSVSPWGTTKIVESPERLAMP